MSQYLREIVNQFAVIGENITYLEPYGEGHINSTYKVVLDDLNVYILQKINNKIFPNVSGLMNNIDLVLTFLKNKISLSGGNPSRETMTIIPTFKGELFYFDKENDSYFRMYEFVKDSVTYQTCENDNDFKNSAIGFSKFAKQLADFDASQLVDVIPNFHNTEKRLEHFIDALKADKYGRASDCLKEIDFILKRKDDCSVLVNLIKEGKIPLRVTHNDTKLNNILFDTKTNKPLCVIDLDTIMPGSILYDFGDSIRFGCNPAGESEKDLSKVIFNKNYFKAFVDGFLSNLEGTLNDYEIKYLAFGAKIMTLECGIRFLDDYLDGDNYFKTSFESQNLVRCRTQLSLVEQMESDMDSLNSIVLSALKK